jgi:hypothetical protein
MQKFAKTLEKNYKIDDICHKDLIILISIDDQKTWFQEGGNGSQIPISGKQYAEIAMNNEIGKLLRERKYVDAVKLITEKLIQEFNAQKVEHPSTENLNPRKSIVHYERCGTTIDLIRTKSHKVDTKIIIICSLICVFILMSALALCYCCKTWRYRVCPSRKKVK